MRYMIFFQSAGSSFSCLAGRQWGADYLSKEGSNVLWD